MELKVYKLSDALPKVQKAIKLYNKGKEEKANRLFERFKDEDPIAAFYFAQSLRNRELEYAITIAERGANMGCAQCVELLAYLYAFDKTERISGPGKKRYEEKAIKLWNSLKDVDYYVGWYHLGLYYMKKIIPSTSFASTYKKEFTGAEKAFKMAIQKGCVAAYYRLACLYINYPIFKQQSKGVLALKAGHFLKDLKCEYKLGCLYLEGDLVKQDIKKGFDLIMHAANEGELLAQLKLATMYYDGHKVDKNEAIAADWIDQASRNGFSTNRDTSLSTDISRASSLMHDEFKFNFEYWDHIAFK